MKAVRPVIIFVIIIFFVSGAAALKNQNIIYSPSVKTVLFYKAGFEMAQPVMSLHEEKGLVLSFDDLDSDVKPYKYTIVHCAFDWTSSENLNVSDYLEGYTEGRIDHYEFSINTLVNYTHYFLEFPDSDLKPGISGNYMIIVYTDTPENPAFTWRFMVKESTPVGVTGQVHQAPGPDTRFTKQEIDFSVNYNGFQVFQPTQIKVAVSQNDRWDNAIINVKPRFTRSESLDFSYDDQILFNGGNEFRAFDIKSLKYQTERIRRIDKESDVTKVILLEDERRTFKKYTFEEDLNGRRLVKNEETTGSSDVEADYVWVVFTLPFEAMRSNGDMYLLGSLTNWELDENSRMTYSFDAKSYTKELLLKQGYYNYIYVFLDKTTGKADESLVEGSHWETENEYSIRVYFRDPGGLYDRLISLQDFNSIKQEKK